MEGSFFLHGGRRACHGGSKLCHGSRTCVNVGRGSPVRMAAGQASDIPLPPA